ncbi:MAG: hypothetical protein M1482_13080, partial [Chloroflexi bacterium]|nr:hypothetical protein [Chloroflexota bacterium]
MASVVCSRLRGAVACFLAMLAALSFSQPQRANAASDLTVYGGALASGWSDWSWDTTVNFNNTSPVTVDSKSIAATFTAAWGGLYLHSSGALSGGDYNAVRFWIHGAAGGQQ